MARYLVVVESPAKARTINKFLGSSYMVKACYGHVRDLPKSSLGVDIDRNFEPQYVQLKESRKAVKELQEAAEKADRILLATDPDREGEAIGWHVAALLEKVGKPAARVVFNEITKRCVCEAAKNPRPIDANLVDAQQARRILDRLVGYKISPLLQFGMQRGLSAGRVQSVAVRMVCEREEAIRNFVPREYWTLDADFLTPREEGFTARLTKVRGEKADLENEGQVQAVLTALDGAEFRVAGVEKKEVKRHPYPPFITSTLQQEASRKLGFAPRKTMVIAQQLYEGIALGAEGRVGLITYMRTDSTRLAQEAIQDVRQHIATHFERAMLPDQPNFYRSKKGAQDAHEAIRPTSAGHTPETIGRFLDTDQLKLYTLIWKRFVACQMASAIFDQTSIDVEAREHIFRATGAVLKFKGFLAMYEETVEDPGEDDATAGLLPGVQKGEETRLQAYKPEQHFTQPPPRFTEASLIRALEENGIGRPSTYAQIMNTIVERGYVVREKRRLCPTPLGENVNNVLVSNFPDILNINFTAELENELDEVEEGQREWHDLLRSFYTEFEKDLHAAQHKIVTETVGEGTKCPKCGSELEFMTGRFGPYLRCVKHPDCDGRVNVKRKKEEEPSDVTCPQCGAPMVYRRSRFGKFLGCSRYPECTYTLKKDGKEKKPAEPVGLKCPQDGCDGDLVWRLGRGKRFVGCSRYPKCRFSVFGDKEAETPCPKCGHPWTMGSKRGRQRIWHCVACNHEHKEFAAETKASEPHVAEQSEV
ncbi:MAG TPA: type I DNA topoisomerase [Candidatus Hydrogenedentes bacterium]|nr:type I DNA topoisomerase [Candidatus Hydrogenedentota bacterium]HQE83963.1 type I DNA topoisomerase [Candidatus Hydrogenedentota bacterium]HQH54518.1 type I DNA topoisomerase [Candidatus Hydrogenedentota bacterium]HQM47927.1 type I DNA topoisomerase [Candidatus Hydrogenedentota bacterium]